MYGPLGSGQLDCSDGLLHSDLQHWNIAPWSSLLPLGGSLCQLILALRGLQHLNIAPQGL